MSHYQTLGIKESANAEEIKSAYRKLAMQYHPDKNNGSKSAEEMFKKISEAYEVLSDVNKKRMYDNQSQNSFFNPGGSSKRRNEDFGFGGFFTSEDLEDILSRAYYGQGQRRSVKQNRGKNFNVNLIISFEESFNGCVKEILINREKRCSECIGNHCLRCGGLGRYNVKETIKVDIPQGATNGIIMTKRRNGGLGDTPHLDGDLIVTLVIRQHDTFTRVGDDVHSVLKISILDLILGCTKFIKTVSGENKLINISRCTNFDQKFSIFGGGFKCYGSQAGDHIISLDVHIPKNLNDEEIIILKGLKESKNFKF